MKSGYSIQWTSHALSELAETIDYLQKNWTDRELKSFSQELDNTLQLISKNPELFPASKSRKSIRRVVVAIYNSLYYRINKDSVEILSFFSNRQDPGKIKIWDFFRKSQHLYFVPHGTISSFHFLFTHILSLTGHFVVYKIKMGTRKVKEKYLCIRGSFRITMARICNPWRANVTKKS